RLDLVHSDTTGLSQVEGTAVWMAGGPTPQFLVDLDIPTLALPTVGLFAPAAGLQGVARGSLRADGTPAQPRFSMQLVAADSGSVTVEGSLDSRGSDLRYDARATLVHLDAAVLSTRA